MATTAAKATTETVELRRPPRRRRARICGRRCLRAPAAGPASEDPDDNDPTDL